MQRTASIQPAQPHDTTVRWPARRLTCPVTAGRHERHGQQTVGPRGREVSPALDRQAHADLSEGVAGPPQAARDLDQSRTMCTDQAGPPRPVTETVVAYDDPNRSLTYQAQGMPSFVTTARNTWIVTPLDNNRCIVTLDAQFDTRDIIGAPARWVTLIQLGRTSRHLGGDLRHFVEEGTPSPRKQRQLQRVGRQNRPT